MQMRGAPIKRSAARERVIPKHLCGRGMATFTVEWLSQSFYSEKKKELEQVTPASPHNSCGYTSGSEGEEGEEGEDSEGEAARRARTKFSSEQVRGLEGAFRRHRYLGASQRRRIAEKLRLSETQVKTWFQNRRMKLKREARGARAEFLAVPAALLPPAMLQHHARPAVHALQEVHRPALHHHLQLHHRNQHHHYHPHPAVHALRLHQGIPAFY